MDAILGFLQSNIVLLGFLIGLAVKYRPELKWVPNSLIPWLNAFIAILTQLFGPAEAHAGILGGFLGHALNPVLAAGWAAIKSALIYEIFARHPLEQNFGWKKA